MIKIENVEVFNWEGAIRGMRNPLNSWSKSDSDLSRDIIGEADLSLMRKLCRAGSDHRKFLRQIMVSMDITAPLYWWKEFDTYKVGTVANSCSTMHTIHKKPFELDDFSHEHLYLDSKEMLEKIIKGLNAYRDDFIREGNKDYWWQLIQLLPTSYNQRRTVTLNYEVLLNMYNSRNAHKLDEWRQLCNYVATMPHFAEICCN